MGISNDYDDDDGLDDEAIDMLAAARDRVFVGPALAWEVRYLSECESIGISRDTVVAQGYEREVEVTRVTMRKLHARGVVQRVAPEANVAFAPLEARNVPSDVPGLPALARRWGVDEATLRRWNPSHRSARWTAATSRHVLLPSDQPRPMASSMSAAPRAPAEAPPPVDPSEEARHHRVVAGETLWRIARRYGVALEALRAANGLAEGDTLRVGVRLRIPD